MPRQINVLHLASFQGNIGDNANHGGFYSALSGINGFDFKFSELEIREFYWKNRFFDEQFIDEVNEYDLLVIGGGNYFELWVEHSPTGTSIMIEPELFKKVNVPVIFNALGVDSGQGASIEACGKFKRFLDVVLSDSKNIVSVRNDGAKETVANLIGNEYLEAIYWTPDAGCNVNVEQDFLSLNNKYMAVNLAGDMLDVRFPATGSYSNFLDVFAANLTEVLEKTEIEELVFIPHIFKDLSCINDILERLPDQVRRSNVTISPLMHGQGAEKKIFSIYANATLTVAMRFHANLCSIALETPTIGLVNYPQIKKLYAELGITNQLVYLDDNDFGKEFKNQVWSTLNNQDDAIEIAGQTSKKMKKEYSKYILRLEQFLRENFT